MKENMKLFWRKKEFCYFILSLTVILMHTLGTDFYKQQIYVSSTNQYIIDLFRIYLNSGAVPLFFIISAVLFFRNVDSFADAKQKALHHLKSLIIPFLLWNTIGIIFNLVIFNIPFIAQYIEVREGIALNLKNIIEGLFFYKYNLLFWYVAQLIIFTALTPLINWILKDKRIAFIVLFLTFMLYFFHIDIPFVIFRKDAFIYYFLGAIIGKYYFNLFALKYSKKLSYFSIATLIAAIIGNSILVNEFVWPILNIVIAFSLWILLQLFEPIYTKEKIKFIECSFFVYAFHYYVEPCISKVLLILLPMNIASMYINNIVAAISTMIISYATAVLLRRYASKFYNLLTGSR